MYGYIYKTTNLINGRMYIGKHASSKFNKDYYGSGKLLWQAINKYGINNFKVEIIEKVYGDNSNLNEREIYWIDTLDAVNSRLYYNIKPGGDGGRGSGWHHKQQFKDKMSNMQKDGKSWMNGKKHSEETKLKMSKSRSGVNHPMYGKHHSEESKLKMRLAKKRNLPKQCGSGKDNPMTGRVWVTNGVHSKPVYKEDIKQYIKLGYRKGRTI